MNDCLPPSTHTTEEPDNAPHAVPRGTLVVIAVLLLALIFMWMLVLGVLQGRA